MKKTISLFSAAALAVLVITAFRPVDITPIATGTAMPMADKAMKDVVSGKEVTLAGQKGATGTLVIFSCNTCPYVVINEGRIADALRTAKRLKFGVVIVNSNEAKRADEDSETAMAKYAKDQKYDCAYTIDVNSELADAFGATRTPECFLFDKDSKLVYHGAIDDSPKDAKAAKVNYLNNAMFSLQKGEAVQTPNTVSVGCTIKRKG
ncbi:MAG: redoxin family protein [Bacteroidia bacterium]|jgi:thioredoxin-related protein|nr:redoxin family protein [Bacteroidia bacterium]